MGGSSLELLSELCVPCLSSVAPYHSLIISPCLSLPLSHCRSSLISPLSTQTEKLENVTGSTAGASSSSFHIYRAHRRTEMNRLEDLDRKETEEQEQEAFERSVEEKRIQSEERTRKLAEKRRRKKQAKKERKKQPSQGQAQEQGKSSDEDESEDEEKEPDGGANKKRKGEAVDGSLVMPVVQLKNDGSFLETMLALQKEKAAKEGKEGEGSTKP